MRDTGQAIRHPLIYTNIVYSKNGPFGLADQLSELLVPRLGILKRGTFMVKKTAVEDRDTIDNSRVIFAKAVVFLLSTSLVHSLGGEDRMGTMMNDLIAPSIPVLLEPLPGVSGWSYAGRKLFPGGCFSEAANNPHKACLFADELAQAIQTRVFGLACYQ